MEPSNYDYSDQNVYADSTFNHETDPSFYYESYDDSEQLNAEANAISKAYDRIKILTLCFGIASVVLCQFAVPLGVVTILLATVGRPKGYPMDTKVKIGLIFAIISFVLLALVIIGYIVLYGTMFASVLMDL